MLEGGCPAPPRPVIRALVSQSRAEPRSVHAPHRNFAPQTCQCGAPDGPMMVDTHSYRLSPLGPAEQLQGGSRLISASSFCIRLALALCFDMLDPGSSHCLGACVAPLTPADRLLIALQARGGGLTSGQEA